MLLRRYAGQWLEPVGIMGRAVVHRPLLHRVSNHVRDGGIQLVSLLDGLLQLLIRILGETLSHHRVVKHIHSKNIRHIDGLAHIPSSAFLFRGHGRRD